jgi:membrane protease YdiL (CAAX protease family)
LTRVAIALGWVALFAAVTIGVTFVISELVPGWGGREWYVARTGVFEVIGFGVATVVVGRLLNRYSWTEMGWRKAAFPRVFAGALLGVLMAAGAIGLAVLLDGARVQFTGDWSLWPSVALPLIVGLVFAALGEELGFRGYPLRRLATGLGVLPAILLLAVLFGLAHVRNPNATVFSTVNVALAAVWLSVAFFSSGGMPLAWGAHFGWNAALAILFDAPVSGLTFQVPVVEYTPGGHGWIDGGAFGPEGGIVATVALAVGTVYLLTRTNAFAEQAA